MLLLLLLLLLPMPMPMRCRHRFLSAFATHIWVNHHRDMTLDFGVEPRGT